MDFFFKISLSILMAVALLMGCGSRDSGAPSNPNAPVPPPIEPGPVSRPAENKPEHLGKPVVILISIDGFRPDYLQKYRPNTLLQWAQSGVVSEGLKPSFPTLTFPNHISLVTGRHPGNHGIVGNTFYDEKRQEAYQMGSPSATKDGSWYRGEPIWTVAEKNGMLSATCFWVGSEAKIGGVDPTYLKPYDGKVSNAQRVQWVIDWLKLPEKQRPHVITLYFSDVDSAGHKYGPWAKETQDAVISIDSELAKLKTFIDRNTKNVQVILVSDHGMVDVKETIDFSSAQNLMKMKDSGRGAIAYFYSDDEKQIQAAYLEAKEIEKRNSGKVKVYLAKDFPKHWDLNDPDRKGDIVIVGEPGYYVGFRRNFEPEASVGTSNKATHGWDASNSAELDGLFIASGSVFQKGKTLPKFENVHVYPLMLKILGLSAIEFHDGDFAQVQAALK